MLEPLSYNHQTQNGWPKYLQFILNKKQIDTTNWLKFHILNISHLILLTTETYLLIKAGANRQQRDVIWDYNLWIFWLPTM